MRPLYLPLYATLPLALAIIVGCSGTGDNEPELSAADWIERGNAALEQGDFRQAANDFSRAIEHDPEAVEAYTGRGRANLEQERYFDALADFDDVLARSHDNLAALKGRASVLEYLGRFVEAIQARDEVLQRSPDDAESLARRAESYRALFDVDRALADLDRAVALDPRYLPQRGAMYADLGQYDKSLDDFTRAIENDPGDAAVHLERGQIYKILGRMAEATADFETVIQLQSQADDTWPLDAQAWFEMGRPEQAVEAYTRALDGELAGSIDLLLDRGEVYDALGQYQNAVDDYSQVLSEIPDEPLVYLYRGRSYKRLAQNERANADFDQAIQLAEAGGQNDVAGMALFEKGEHQEAIERLSLALDERVRSRTIYYYRGAAHLELGDTEAAIDDLDEAIRLSPGYADAYRKRAAAFEALSKTDEAAADRGKAEELSAGAIE